MNAYLPHPYPTISHPAASPLTQRRSPFSPIPFAPKPQHILERKRNSLHLTVVCG